MGIFNSLFGSGGKKKTIVLVMIKFLRKVSDSEQTTKRAVLERLELL